MTDVDLICCKQWTHSLSLNNVAYDSCSLYQGTNLVSLLLKSSPTSRLELLLWLILDYVLDYEYFILCICDRSWNGLVSKDLCVYTYLLPCRIILCSICVHFYCDEIKKMLKKVKMCNVIITFLFLQCKHSSTR